MHPIHNVFTLMSLLQTLIKETSVTDTISGPIVVKPR